MDYYAYIKSSRWFARRSRFIKETNAHDCYVCFSGEKLHLHHKTYKRLGKERNEDLVLLCKLCHMELHRYYNRVKKKGISLFEASEKYICRKKKKFQDLLDAFDKAFQPKPKKVTLARTNSRGERVEIANKALPGRNAKALKSYLG